MTANMIKGKGFRGALRYNLAKVEQGVAQILDHSFLEVSEDVIMKEISLIKALRPNLQRYFYHTSLNFPPKEDLPDDLIRQIAREYLTSSGFNQHQFILFRHNDTDHPHIHILVNRIGYDGSLVSDSNDYARCEQILRDLERKFNLTQVSSSRQAKERSLTKNELEMMKRTNTPSRKLEMQRLIKKIISNKSRISTSEFITALQERNIDVLFNIASTGFVSGISYSFQGLTITGSGLGRDFNWNSIKKQIDYHQERDHQLIHQINDRTNTVKKVSKRTSDHYQKTSSLKELKRIKFHTKLESSTLPDQDQRKLINTAPSIEFLTQIIHNDNLPSANQVGMVYPQANRKRRRKKKKGTRN